MRLSVLIPTHNPDRTRLTRTLAGLCAQTLPARDWEIVLVDNASIAPVAADIMPANGRIVREPVLGLTAARRRGLHEARGEFVVLVDDDNVLEREYLEHVLRLSEDHPRLAAFGGRSVPEFEVAPPAWVREFDGLIACRDLGATAQVFPPSADARAPLRDYPACAPIGAGMALRRQAVQAWLEAAGAARLSDRRGGELTSGGDNDIVLTLVRHGWQVGYFPELTLTHLIPAARTTRDYLARLNRGIAKSWVQVLHQHGLNPWPAVPAWTVPLRQAKAWFTYHAWSGPAAHVRWQGACGHFEGLAALDPVAS